MSIYVSIPCLGIDQELIKTIRSCFEHADSPDNIYIGIAFIGDKKFKEFIEKEIETYGYKNIKTSYTSSKAGLGVGKGRLLASLMYDNQDYYVQIDAHTLFDVGWDTYFKDKFEKAKVHVNNNKIALTGYPGKYGYYDSDGNLDFWIHPVFQYPHWIPDKFLIQGKTIPVWSDSAPWEINKDLYELIDKTGFAPIGKVCAAFIFTDKNFIDDKLCLEVDSGFWEEEILQTMNMFGNGYTLVYPGHECKVYHYYIGEGNEIKNGVGMRQSYNDFMASAFYDEYTESMEKKFKNYVVDPKNLSKVLMFQEYNNVNLVHGTNTDNYYPTEYINYGKNPVN